MLLRAIDAVPVQELANVLEQGLDLGCAPRIVSLVVWYGEQGTVGYVIEAIEVDVIHVRRFLWRSAEPCLCTSTNCSAQIRQVIELSA